VFAILADGRYWDVSRDTADEVVRRLSREPEQAASAARLREALAASATHFEPTHGEVTAILWAFDRWVDDVCAAELPSDALELRAAFALALAR
jgi:hypothetical protein